MKMRVSDNLDSLRRFGSAVFPLIRIFASRRGRWQFLLLAILFIFQGCGLFTTRDPESPVGSQSGSDPAVSPSEVLDRLATAIAIRNPELYLQVIDTGFAHRASPSAYPDNPAVFEDWHLQQETLFIRRLTSSGTIPATSPASLQFEPIDQVDWIDSVLRIERYELEVNLVTGDLPDFYSGEAEILMVRTIAEGWKMRRWNDESTGELPTISYLKAAL